MHPYIRNLVALLLASSSASMATRSLAQTLVETNNNNTGAISSQSVSTSQSNFGGSTNSRPVILSDGASNTASATDDNPRIPISSKVFSAPSMQQ